MQSGKIESAGEDFPQPLSRSLCCQSCVGVSVLEPPPPGVASLPTVMDKTCRSSTSDIWGIGLRGSL